LNDLYRRVINRNNRLKKLMDLHDHEGIVRNESDAAGSGGRPIDNGLWTRSAWR